MPALRDWIDAKAPVFAIEICQLGTSDDKIHEDLFTKKMGRFIEHLQVPDSLSCAVVSASFIDSILVNVLKRRFIKTDIAKDLLKHNGGALGTIFSRSAVAYSLGMISKPCFTNIQAIAEIRNKFAHLVEDVTFDSEDVQKCCNKLIPPVAPFVVRGPGFQISPFALWHGKNDARSKFCNVALHVFVYLQFALVEQRRATAPNQDKSLPRNCIWDD